jgi:hypothetical protein
MVNLRKPTQMFVLLAALALSSMANAHNEPLSFALERISSLEPAILFNGGLVGASTGLPVGLPGLAAHYARMHGGADVTNVASDILRSAHMQNMTKDDEAVELRKILNDFPFIGPIDALKMAPVCRPIAEILGTAYDRSSVLLMHGIGRSNGGMCALSVYMNVRLALRDIVVKDGGIGLAGDNKRTVCVKPFYFVMQAAIEDGMLKKAKEDGTLIVNLWKISKDQEEALSAKRMMASDTPLSETLMPEDVMPIPEKDFLIRVAV